MTGRIFATKRFAIHDGPGIRTTVFLKGCPLRCPWCHNPEGISPHPQLAYTARRCIQCGECAKICSCHTMKNGVHQYNRHQCLNYGLCADTCLGGALIHYGQDVSVDEIMPKLLEDKDYFDASGGGVTLSGGEPTMQMAFCEQLLKELKGRNIHTALDTCGIAAQEDYLRLLPYVDLFLYDIKAADEQLHVKLTGQSNQRILENLRVLDQHNAKIQIRIPFIEGVNDQELVSIGEIIQSLHHPPAVNVLPYHDLAENKYEALGMQYTLSALKPTSMDSVRAARDKLAGMGIAVEIDDVRQ